MLWRRKDQQIPWQVTAPERPADSVELRPRSAPTVAQTLPDGAIQPPPSIGCECECGRRMAQQTPHIDARSRRSTSLLDNSALIDPEDSKLTKLHASNKCVERLSLQHSHSNSLAAAHGPFGIMEGPLWEENPQKLACAAWRHLGRWRHFSRWRVPNPSQWRHFSRAD